MVVPQPFVGYLKNNDRQPRNLPQREGSTPLTETQFRTGTEEEVLFNILKSRVRTSRYEKTRRIEGKHAPHGSCNQHKRCVSSPATLRTPSDSQHTHKTECMIRNSSFSLFFIFGYRYNSTISTHLTQIVAEESRMMSRSPQYRRSSGHHCPYRSLGNDSIECTLRKKGNRGRGFSQFSVAASYMQLS